MPARLPRLWLPLLIDDAAARVWAEREARPAQSRSLARHIVRRGLWLGAPLVGRPSSLTAQREAWLPLLALVDALAEATILVLDEELPAEAIDAARVKARLLLAMHQLYAAPRAGAVDYAGSSRAVERAQHRLGSALRRHRYLAGNPLVGLTLHHALTAVDIACLLDLVRLQRVPLDPAKIEARCEARRRELAATVAGAWMLAHTRDEVEDAEVSDLEVWHIKALGLGRVPTASLRDAVAEVAQRLGRELARDDLSREGQLAAAHQSTAEFVVEQCRDAGAGARLHTALSVIARLDGRVTEGERAFLDQVARATGLTTSAAGSVRRRVDRFCRVHRDDLDPLLYAAAFEAEGATLSTKLARALSMNASQLWNEIRETGDLALLLAKRAGGQKLTKAEQGRMREQLLDVARVVPGLAAFTLPGGMLLLPILFRVLPFDLRPSSFRPSEFDPYGSSDEIRVVAGAGTEKLGSQQLESAVHVDKLSKVPAASTKPRTGGQGE